MAPRILRALDDFWMYQDARFDDETSVFCPKGSLLLPLGSLSNECSDYAVFLVEGKIIIDFESLQVGALHESLFETVA